jgi:hypothetical protein
MHCGVIRAVLAFDRWEVAREPDAAGTMHVGEIGPRDLVILIDIRGDRPAGDRDGQFSRFLLETNGRLRVRRVSDGPDKE